MVITAQWHYLLVESAFTVHFLFMKLLTVDTMLGVPRVKERVKPSGADLQYFNLTFDVDALDHTNETIVVLLCLNEHCRN